MPYVTTLLWKGLPEAGSDAAEAAERVRPADVDLQAADAGRGAAEDAAGATGRVACHRRDAASHLATSAHTALQRRRPAEPRRTTTLLACLHRVPVTSISLPVS